MDKTSRNLSIIAYYLSEYDMKAVNELGYKTRAQAIKDISIKLGRDNNYLKLRRDEFDVLTSSSRQGWHKRAVIKDVQNIFNSFSVIGYNELTDIVKEIISEAEKETEVEIADQMEDKRFIEDVNRAVQCNVGKKTFADHPKELNGNKKVKSYSVMRNSGVAANALCNADYKCEYCVTHETFIRKSNGKPYTEPHHLIPMKYQQNFKVSLDVENNIVSLCSNCHNRLHYGANIDEVLEILYSKRKLLLEMAGIKITYEDLKKYYQS